MITPTRDDWLWVAGFFDGEGGITLQTSGNNLLVGIGQRQEAIIRDIINLFGGHLQDDTTPEGRPMWHARWGSQNALAFLEGILPYLRIKRDEVQFAIDWIKVDRSFPRPDRDYSPLSPTHRQWRQEMARRLLSYREDRSNPLYISLP